MVTVGAAVAPLDRFFVFLDDMIEDMINDIIDQLIFPCFFHSLCETTRLVPSHPSSTVPPIVI